MLKNKPPNKRGRAKLRIFFAFIFAFYALTVQYKVVLEFGLNRVNAFGVLQRYCLVLPRHMMVDMKYRDF